MGFEWLGKHGHVSRQGTCGGWRFDGASFYIFYQLYSFKIKKINKCPSMKIFGLFPSNLMNCP